MFCTRCGAGLAPTATLCSACGAATGTGLDPARVVKRPALITLLAVLQFLGGAVLIPLGVVIFLVQVGSDDPEAGLGMGIGLVWLLMGTANLFCGIGLWKLKPFGRTLQIVLAAIGLLGIPVGTIIGGLILYYMYRPGIRLLFSGKPAGEYTAAELAEAAEVTLGSAAVTIVIVVFVAIGAVAMIGIIAAIAVPGLLRARMAGNEAVAIGSMRSIVSAQAAYSAAAGSGGYATRLETLVAACPETSQGFLTPDLARDPSVKSGYTVSLQSAGVDRGPDDCNGVPTERDFYASAEPVQFNTTGVRAFSTSATGIIYFSDMGRAPSADDTLNGTATPLR